MCIARSVDEDNLSKMACVRLTETRGEGATWYAQGLQSDETLEHRHVAATERIRFSCESWEYYRGGQWTFNRTLQVADFPSSCTVSHNQNHNNCKLHVERRRRIQQYTDSRSIQIAQADVDKAVHACIFRALSFNYYPSNTSQEAFNSEGDNCVSPTA